MRKYSLRKKALSSLMAILTGLVLMPAVKVNAASEYTVTFRPGKVGQFDLDEAKLNAVYGEGNYTITTNKAIKVTVPAGGQMPAAYPYVDAEAGYFVKTWGPDENVVTKNVDFVVDYGKLVDGVEYTIKYVDSESGESVAPFVTAYANKGDTIQVTAPAVLKNSDAGTYILQSEETKEITLQEDAAQNVIAFEYTNNYDPGTVDREIINYVDGGTTTVTETYVTTIDNGTATEAGATVFEGGAGAGDNGADNEEDNNQGTVTIDDEDTPLAGSLDEDNENGQDEDDVVVVIEEEETPLSDHAEVSDIMNPAVLWACVAGLAAGALTAVWLTKKKKSKTDDIEEE